MAAKRSKNGGGAGAKVEPTAKTKARTKVKAKVAVTAMAKLAVRADGSYVLTKEEDDRLALLLDEATVTASDMATRMLSFGRLVLREVFHGDAAAARDPVRSSNPLWLEFRRRAGGPTLRLNKKFISVAVRIAAWDKTITDEAWRNLDPPRKELLLPLDDADRLREAAQRVSKFKLDDEATEEYVKGLRAESDAAPKTRLTPARARSQTRKYVQRMRSGGAVQRIGEAAATMTARERADLHAEIEELERLAQELRKAVGRKP